MDHVGYSTLQKTRLRAESCLWSLQSMKYFIVTIGWIILHFHNSTSFSTFAATTKSWELSFHAVSGSAPLLYIASCICLAVCDISLDINEEVKILIKQSDKWSLLSHRMKLYFSEELCALCGNIDPADNSEVRCKFNCHLKNILHANRRTTLSKIKE